MRLGRIILIGVVCLLAGFLLGRNHQLNKQRPRVIVQTDTIVKLDTITRERPVFRYSYIHDTVRTYFTTVRRDTVLVDVPIETRVYAEDSLYRAVVSGWRPSLDSMTVYPKTVTITIKEREITPAPRWSVGVTAGPSVLATPSGKVHGGLGITAGLHYSF